ncbi:MAG: hypothetical protein IJS97_03305 [Prevotella sp.]|nr:hypothetical protein [Prevotella sp.]
MNISIYTLTSELHDEQSVAAVTRDFLGSLNFDYEFKGSDYSDYGSHPLDLIYVRTGGTEGIFQRILPQLRLQSASPFYLLTSGKSNSLAASMEILSYLRQHGLEGEIIHGTPQYVSRRISLLARVGEVRNKLQGKRLGIIGKPSDWLISSHADADKVKERLGIELVHVPMQELLETIPNVPVHPLEEPAPAEYARPCVVDAVKQALPGAHQIYEALRMLVAKHQLQGLTIRCFDLLTAVHNTGCVALAKLNSEGIVAGCEGDVPAMLTMKIAQALLGVSGFLANPASINTETGEILFAHCTIPFNMVERYEYDTHFESGIGVGIRGYMKEGPVTIFKVSGDLSRCFVEEGMLERSQGNPDLCRTQQVIRLSDASKASYFLTNPIGNHHVILPGHHKEVLSQLLKNETGYQND